MRIGNVLLTYQDVAHGQKVLEDYNEQHPGFVNEADYALRIFALSIVCYIYVLRFVDKL